MKLLPFNLERAFSGEEVVTRDGRSVSCLHLYGSATSPYRVSALVSGKVELFTIDGKHGVLEEQSDLDLFLLQKTMKIGGVRIPSPLTSPPDVSIACFFVDITQREVVSQTWEGTYKQHQRLINGFIYSGDDEESANEALTAWMTVLYDLGYY